MKYLVPFFLFLFISAPALAVAIPTNLTLGWDANTEADLAGYRIYSTHVPGDYILGPNGEGNIADVSVPSTETTIDLSSEQDGNICFVATAYDISGNESGPSNEICWELDTSSPNTPTNFKIIVYNNGELIINVGN